MKLAKWDQVDIYNAIGQAVITGDSNQPGHCHHKGDDKRPGDDKGNSKHNSKHLGRHSGRLIKQQNPTLVYHLTGASGSDLVLAAPDTKNRSHLDFLEAARLPDTQWR